MSAEFAYYTAQVCLNGHVITASLEARPELAKKFCAKCGERTMTECRECGAPLQGELRVLPEYTAHHPYQAPFYCHNCGTAFPWTQRKLAAITIAVQASDLTAEEQGELQDAAEHILKRTPEADGAAQRVKLLLAKAGAGLGQAVRNILVEVASEAVKKQIGW